MIGYLMKEMHIVQYMYFNQNAGLEADGNHEIVQVQFQAHFGKPGRYWQNSSAVLKPEFTKVFLKTVLVLPALMLSPGQSTAYPSSFRRHPSTVGGFIGAASQNAQAVLAKGLDAEARCLREHELGRFQQTCGYTAAPVLLPDQELERKYIHCIKTISFSIQFKRPLT